MKYRKLLLALLVIPFIFSCGTRGKKVPSKNATPVEIVQLPDADGARPGWVRKRPIDDDYYIGIAMVEKRPGFKEYKDKAFKEALSELCSQIQVTVSSNSYLITINRDYKFQQDYLTSTKSSVNTNIEGYRIVDEFENDREYWVYLSLNREEYKQREREKMQQASATAVGFIREARQFAKSSYYPSAILFYGKALASMRNYLNQAVETEIDGKSCLIVNETFNELQRLINNIRIEFSDSSEEMKFGLPLNRRFSVSAYTRDQNKTRLNDLPVRFSFTSGKGNITTEMVTNNQGKGMLTVFKITSSQAYQEIEAALDFEKMCSADTAWRYFQPFIKQLSVPAHRMLIQVTAPKFYSSSSERNIDTPLEEPILMKHIDKRLFENGLQLTMNKQEADFIFELSSNTQQVNVAYDMITCHLQFNLSIKDRSGKTVYTHQKNDIKGIRLKQQEAGMYAYRNGTEYIDTNVMPEFNKLLFQ
jgi:hypothetical protein